MSNEQSSAAPAYEFTNEGWYDARAKTWRWMQAKSGNWMLEVWFELSEHGAVLGDLPGWLVFTQNTLDKRLEQLLAMGYVPVTGDMGQEIGCDEAGNCFGGIGARSVRAVVKYDDDGRAKVDNIVPQKPKAAQTVDAGALRAFGAQMRGAVMAAAQRAKAAGGAAPAARTAPQARPAPQPQRPAPQPTRGPQTQRPVEEAPSFDDADACPF